MVSTQVRSPQTVIQTKVIHQIDMNDSLALLTYIMYSCYCIEHTHLLYSIYYDELESETNIILLNFVQSGLSYPILTEGVISSCYKLLSSSMQLLYYTTTLHICFTFNCLLSLLLYLYVTSFKTGRLGN